MAGYSQRPALVSASEPLAVTGGLQCPDEHSPVAGPRPRHHRALVGHITRTTIDLVGLVTGAKGGPAELAGMRGLGAARLSAILGEIEAGFTNHQISTQPVADELGLSTRYVHDLLTHTGNSFAEQRTAQMLSDRRFQHMRVSDIALAAGFSDVSYFNRSFRRRFGMTPGSAR